MQSNSSVDIELYSPTSELGEPSTFDRRSSDESALQYSESDSEDEEVIQKLATHGYSLSHLHSQSYQKAKTSAVYRDFFLKNVPIHVHIKDAKLTEHSRNPFHHRKETNIREWAHVEFNPYLYEIHLRHGQFSWTIFRRYRHFRQIHDITVLKRMRLGESPEPSTSTKLEHPVERRSTIMRMSDRIFRRRKEAILPPFPRGLEIAVRKEEVDLRVKQLQDYLQAALNVPVLRNTSDVTRFLEVSRVSFIGSLGEKMKEGILLKRTHWACRPPLHGCWGRRWFFLKDTFLGYMHIDTWEISEIMLMDQSFHVEAACINGKHYLLITNSTRGQMTLYVKTEQKLEEWKLAISRTVATTGKPFVRQNAHGSFAPMRENVPISWFVDGALYLDAVATAIEDAKEEIFICDWWLCPQLYLKRPIENEFWRLDNMLLRKAEEGINIYIMLYKELELVLSLSSTYTKSVLNGLHANIKILRHPDHVRNRVLLWAHHEKCVIVDQKIAFLGGIDLCYGRWDTPAHAIVDVAAATYEPTTRLTDITFDIPTVGSKSVCSGAPDVLDSADDSQTGSKWCFGSGAENGSMEDHPCDSYIASSPPNTLYNVGTYLSSLDSGHSRIPKIEVTQPSPIIERREVNREDPSSASDSGLKITSSGHVPGRSIELVSVKSDQPSDISRLSVTTGGHRTSLLNTILPQSTTRLKRGSLAQVHLQMIQNNLDYKSLPDGQVAVKAKIKPQSARATLRETATVLKAGVRFRRVLHKHQDFTDLAPSQQRPSTSRPPHDVEDNVEVPTKSIWVGKDYVNWIVQDCVDISKPNDDLVDRCVVPRMPWHDIGCVVYGRSARDVARHFIQRWNAVKSEKASKRHDIPFLVPRSYDRSGICQTWSTCKCAVQVLRSSTRWSAGISHTENSILSAYLEAIEDADHYVYIENQFFMTSCGHSSFARNTIGEALFRRIMRAHRRGEMFRVFIMLPLLPAFQGDVGKDTGTTIHTCLHYLQASLCKGENALLPRLAKVIGDPLKYISVVSVRNYGKLNGKMVTEQIYIHSKLMIVDDRKVIIGSANINDRSMLGSRDSELAVVVSDRHLCGGKMGGKPAQVGQFASTLRLALMREHLGISPGSPNYAKENEQLADPVADIFYKNLWLVRAAKNTRIYDKVFNCIPTDMASTLAELDELRSRPTLAETSPAEAEKMLIDVRGHLILFPIHFLSNENMAPTIGTKEVLLPVNVFV